MGNDVVHTVVFADGPGGGNPCPVVFGADELGTAEMQARAAGFGHETAFVLRPREGGDVRLRYFVPRHEMEMCVHATVATVLLLARDGQAVSRVETPLGLRRVAVEPDASAAMIEQSAPAFGEPVDAGAVADVLGTDAVAGPARSVSTARPKLLVPLAGEAALDGLRPDFPRLWSRCGELGVTGFYPYAREAAGADAAARQFPRDAGYDEDPATGVAACALAAHLTAEAGEDGWHEWTIAQGRAMGRPSRIQARALRDAGRVTETWVGGTMELV